jgi:glycosyltransferase involved in cell wall biosynthesis
VLDELARARAIAAHRAAIAQVLRSERVDVVHMHGSDFHAYLPSSGPPVLVTLHLPIEWYPRAALQPERSDVYLHCVSTAQQATCPRSAALLPNIQNGVALDQLWPSRRKADFVLALGRICPEKGFHDAIEAAARAGIPLVLAGQVFRYPAHEAYFREHIAPRMGPGLRFIGPIGLARKRRLLGAARCVLVPSLVPETSSLVAMEALACGTPVVAYPKGALSELVVDGNNGFLVQDVAQMAAAIPRASAVSPARCRAVAELRCSEAAMLARYFDYYAALARRTPPLPAAEEA